MYSCIFLLTLSFLSLWLDHLDRLMQRCRLRHLHALSWIFHNFWRFSWIVTAIALFDSITYVDTDILASLGAGHSAWPLERL